MLASAQVVAAIAALVTTAAGMTGRVFTDRVWPLSADELPAWRVVADGEEIDPTGVSFPATQLHELTVLCKGYVRATEAVDDAMHTLAADAIAAIFATSLTTRLSPLNCTTALTRIERDMETEGEAAIGRITLALRVRFHTFNNAPETIL
jgi:hypothetical protein